MADPGLNPPCGYEFPLIDFPADDYELQVMQHELGAGRHYLRLRVRATESLNTLGIGEEVVASQWSPWSEPIYVPEAPALPTLAALLVGLIVLYWWRRRESEAGSADPT